MESICFLFKSFSLRVNGLFTNLMLKQILQTFELSFHPTIRHSFLVDLNVLRFSNYTSDEIK